MTLLPPRMTATLIVLMSPICVDADDVPRPRIVAHRGLLHHAPENTLAGFRACLELGIGFEFDVERTKDSHLICIHDPTVDRTTSGKGKVSHLTFAQIRAFDAGSWFDPRFAGEKVPRVDEVLKLVAESRNRGVLIAVDLKAEGVEEEVVRMGEKLGILNSLLFIGRTISEPKLRERIKGTSAKAHTAVVANNVDEFPKALAAPDADWVYFRFLPTKQQVDAVHAQGKRVFIAGTTVSGHVPDNWRTAIAAGVDGVLTDYSLELATMLTRKHR